MNLQSWTTSVSSSPRSDSSSKSRRLPRLEPLLNSKRTLKRSSPWLYNMLAEFLLRTWPLLEGLSQLLLRILSSKLEVRGSFERRRLGSRLYTVKRHLLILVIFFLFCRLFSRLRDFQRLGRQRLKRLEAIAENWKCLLIELFLLFIVSFTPLVF